MTFVRPTLTQLIAQAKSDIETHLPGADAQLRRSVESVLARVVAGAAHGLHGHLVWLSKQLIPDTAQDEWIVRWASIWLSGEIPIQATKAAGAISSSGNTPATVVPAGTLWQTNDSVQYSQDSSATVTGPGVLNANVTAVVAGDAGNQSAGTILSLVSPIAGINSSATVGTLGISGGNDTETAADLLVRLLERLQSPPKGGGPGDYIAWAKEVTGVTRAWELACIDGPGEVALYFVRDNDSGSIIPSAGEVAQVQAYIDTKAPITADVTVYAPTGIAFNVHVDVTNYTGSWADVSAAIEAELDDLLLRESEPGCTIYLSQINEAISIATGEIDHILIAPAADIAYADDEMPIKGTYTIDDIMP